jgi:ABC-type multidrug transport system fused ATPase/permease subunit
MSRSSTEQPVPTPADTYRARRERFAAACRILAARSGRLSQARTGVFLLLVALGLLAERRPGPVPVILATAAAAAFVALVVAHRRVRRREEWYRELVSINEEGLHRLARDWDRLPVHVPQQDLSAHAYAGDLDLFGRASLTQVLAPAGSAMGARTLEDWLLARARPAEIERRQAAVRELAPLHDLREALAINGRRTRTVRAEDVERFLQWAESPAWLSRMAWLRAAAWILPAATWLLIALHAFGVVDAAFWMVPALLSLTLYFTTGARVGRTLDAAFGREGMFTNFPELIALVTGARFEAPLLRDIEQRLGQDGAPADRQLDGLRRLMHLADVRLSTLHVPLYLVTLWDVHVLRALERWQRAHGASARDWLVALGELEALASLAALAHDQPDWVYAELRSDGERVLDAQSLGHPLLSDDARVTNDVSVGPPGTFLLVTGSNMSGKSTLLRALGANAVLAQAGAPSCARTLRMPPLDVQTSIRVQDSLARGVSYFMAELERLKLIVDAAQQTQRAGEATVLFLLDEILHGTNTTERRIAASRVIRHLVDMGAIGAATTHDLELAEEPMLAPSARLVHFRETFTDASDGPATLTFDYLLRDGIATSTNALALMRIVGLPGE